MATITCKIPEELNQLLEAEALRQLVPKSALVRKALERCLKNGSKTLKASAFDQVRELCGVIKEGPRDLSSNPIYMEGFGQ